MGARITHGCRAFRGGCIRGASARSRGGADIAVGGRHGRRRGRRGALPLRAAALQEPHAGRRRRQGLQKRGDRRGHRRGYSRPRRAQPGGDPADVGRQHPDLEEGHVRSGHPQPHRDHHRLADRHRQRAVPHRAEDTGGGTQAHPPQRHLQPHAVTVPVHVLKPGPPVRRSVGELSRRRVRGRATSPSGTPEPGYVFVRFDRSRSTVSLYVG